MGLHQQTQISPAKLIRHWLERELDGDTLAWLDAAALAASAWSFGEVERALALAGRKIGKGSLALADRDLAQARAAQGGWSPRLWTLADAGRAYLLLPLSEDPQGFGETFKRLCQTADLGTLIGLYRATPLFPASQSLDWQIGEGLRTSIRAVFEAIAHDNPVPAERFSEHRWNHMVLKALFVDSMLDPIIGLDERRNAALAETLLDHVHERRAAGRSIDLQVWRCIAPFARGAVLDDIAPLIGSGDRAERLAATLCLRESPDPAANRLLSSLIAEQQAVASGAVTWEMLSA